jgi:L-alanine-DL-glutamate epimerase-like enolase superfamily enzyme
MKITNLRTDLVRVPLTQPARWSGGTRMAAPAVLLTLETDEGLTGYGEAVGPTLAPLQTILEVEFRPFLIGADPMRSELALHRLEELTVNWASFGSYAISAVEMALLDLKGKALNTPLVNLLGGIYRESVEWMGYVFIDEPQANAALARRYVSDGYGTLKVKVGRDIDEDAARLKSIRETVGSDIKIRVDANMAWGRSTARRAIAALEPFDLQYVEQPLPWYDIDGMAELPRSVDVPIAADESCTGVREAARLIEAGACEVLVLYISEAGGLTRAQQIIRMAENAGVACVLGTWAELGVGTAAGAHLIASSRNFPFANDTHYPLQSDDILTQMLPFQKGRLALPSGPGLGVEIDPARVERFSRTEVRDQVFYDADNPAFIPRIGQIL